MIRVTVPASTANLGAGFDAMGMALDVYNVIRIEPADQLTIVADHPNVPLDEHNLIWQSMCAAFQMAGKKPIPVRLEQKDHIPMTRGMGSSSACIVGGVVAANALMGGPLSQQQMAELVVTMEGHPDNVLPALVGGLVVAASDPEMGVQYVRMMPHPRFSFRVLVPDYPLSTEKARAVLPEHYERRQVVYNLERVLLMATSLQQGLPENLAVGAQDCIHQPYRKQLIEGYDTIEAAAKASGALCMTLSGAGPSLFCILDGEHPDFESKMMAVLKTVPGSWQILKVNAQMGGTQVVSY